MIASDLIKKPKGFENSSFEELYLWEVREKEWYANLGRKMDPTLIQIEWFQVYDEFLCKGYGRRGYEILEKELRRLGFSQIILDIDEGGPKEFWEKMGFTQTSGKGNWLKMI